MNQPQILVALFNSGLAEASPAAAGKQLDFSSFRVDLSADNNSGYELAVPESCRVQKSLELGSFFLRS